MNRSVACTRATRGLGRLIALVQAIPVAAESRSRLVACTSRQRLLNLTSTSACLWKPPVSSSARIALVEPIETPVLAAVRIHGPRSPRAIECPQRQPQIWAGSAASLATCSTPYVWPGSTCIVLPSVEAQALHASTCCNLRKPALHAHWVDARHYESARADGRPGCTAACSEKLLKPPSQVTTTAGEQQSRGCPPRLRTAPPRAARAQTASLLCITYSPAARAAAAAALYTSLPDTGA